MRWIALVSCLALAGSYLLGGTAPLGRLALSIGLPHLAATLFSDPVWRGVALYRAGDYAAAEEAFRASNHPYNAGNTLVQAGEFAAALEAYDRAIAQGNADAQANFDLVSIYYAGLGIDAETLGLFPERKTGPSAESFIAQGDARAAGTGSEVNNANTMLGLAELDSRGRLGVRRIFDDTFIVADERWLQQLTDVPGEYMRARIAHEQKRRQKAGLSPEEVNQ